MLAGTLPIVDWQLLLRFTNQKSAINNRQF
jgi:hypothetical protein